MKLQKNDVVTLENGNDYLVVDVAEFNNITYGYFTNVTEDAEAGDSMFRKIVIKGEGWELNPLENEDEFDVISQVFFNRNKEVFKEDE